MKYLLILTFFVLGNCKNTKNKIITKQLYYYDTLTSIDKANPHYSVNMYDSNNTCIANYEYNSENKLINSNENYNWGWYSIEYNDSAKNIDEFLNADSAKDRKKVELNNEFYVKKNGDTICEKSCYYYLKNFQDVLDSNKSVEFLVYIPCSGFPIDSEISFDGSLTITDNVGVFKLHEFYSKKNIIKIDIGKLKSGNYTIYGKLYIYHMIKGTKVSDSFRTLYIDKEITIR